jgi:hypothetical protein
LFLPICIVDSGRELVISTRHPLAQGFPAVAAQARLGKRRKNTFVTVPAVITEPEAGRRRLLPLVLVAGALAAVAATGCGEKSEPSVHPPTTAPTTTAPPVTTAPPATTTAKSPTAPVPKTTP